jgi:competence protein ComEC
MDVAGIPALDCGRAALSSGMTPGPRAFPSQPVYQPLVVVVAAVATGICIDRVADTSRFAAGRIDTATGVPWFAVYWWLAAACLITWWVAWQRHRSLLASAALLLSAACCGGAWNHMRWDLFDRFEIGRYADRELAPVCIEAVASRSPERVRAPHPTPLRAIPGSERTRIGLRLTSIRDATTWRPAAGDCELMVEGHVLGVRAGDRLRVFGQITRTGAPLNPGEFDFAAHARADGQLVRMRSSAPESVTLVQRATRLTPTAAVDDLRSGAIGVIRRFIGPQRSDLASAILLGSRGGLTPEETEPYLLTGTIHVLVVSGLNVAIIATGLYWLMRIGCLSRRMGLAIIMAIVIGYALVAQAQPPVMRAAVFAILICVGAWTGRRGAAFNSLAFAALVVLAMNPSDLFRAGPQLSFLAVGALIWIGLWTESRRRDADPLDRLIDAARSWPERGVRYASRWTGWLLLTSFAVWLVTLPLLLHQFHLASPISILISPAIWIVVFAAMWSGFFMLVVGWLVPAIGQWCGYACDASLGCLESLVRWAESLPGGHFWTPGPALWWVVVFYLGLMTAMLRGRSLAPPRWQLAALCGWVVIGLVPPLVREVSRGELAVSFAAVGHGTCVLIETPTGETLLYDAGSLGSPEYATQRIASYLWHRGIMRIDGILISHADVDHYNAVPGLLERFNVGTVYVSPMMFDGIGESVARGPEVLRENIRAAGVPIREVWAGDRLRVGKAVSADVLHPTRMGVLGSDNANSIVLAIEHAGRRVLLPGDLESPGIEAVMAELPYGCDVLLAPHHGSRRSDPPGFAAWSTPEWVVISGGASGEEIEPVVKTYERAGARVLETYQHGMVEFSFGPAQLEMASWWR